MTGKVITADIVIVGAGISGLYIGNKLLDQFSTRKIVILEKNARVGGRIYTKTYQKMSYESGAGRIKENDVIWSTLIERYGMALDKITMKGSITPIITRKINDAAHSIEYYFDKIFNYLDRNKDVWTSSELSMVSFYDYLSHFLSKKEIRHFYAISGYSGDLDSVNAYFGIESIRNTIDNHYQYYTIKKGLSQMIDKLKIDFTSRGGILCTDRKVLRLGQTDRHYHIYTIGSNHYRCSQLCLTLSPSEMEKIGIYFPFFQYIVPVSLCRIYYHYRSQQKWLTTLSKIITDSPLQFIIPVSKHSIMISYSDGKVADEWYLMYRTMDSKDFMKMIEKYFKIVCQKDSILTTLSLPVPDKMTIEYWKDGVHVWKKGIDISDRRVYDRLLHPIEGFYLANEAYSKKQGWSEGSLEVSNRVVELLIDEIEQDRNR